MSKSYSFINIVVKVFAVNSSSAFKHKIVILISVLIYFAIPISFLQSYLSKNYFNKLTKFFDPAAIRS